jgi:hypothetical protein
MVAPPASDRPKCRTFPYKSDRVETAIPGLILARRDEPSEPINILYEPRICVIAQGAKRVQLGDDACVYDILR